MKKTFESYSKLIKAWLSRHYESGKTRSTMSGFTHENVTRMFFEGDSLYSYGYHYEMARMVKGGEVILINNYNYSKTTCKQMAKLQRELNGFRVYHVSDIGWNIRCINDYKRRIEKTLLLAKRCRSSWRLRSYLASARNLVFEAASFIKEFDLPSDERIDWLMKYQDNMLIDRGIFVV